MVKGCFINVGQFQVVIGIEVGDYYNVLLEIIGKVYVDKEQVKKVVCQNMKWYEQLIFYFVEIFFLLLLVLISGGLILGFCNVIGDVLVGICWLVVKKMGGMLIFGIVFGVMLVLLQLMNVYLLGQ